MSDDLISRQAAIDALETIGYDFSDSELSAVELEELCEAVGDVRQDMINRIRRMPSAEPERLTDDDFETIRIHLNAHKEKLCNQNRWEEAEEYQRIIDRFMAFASAQAENTLESAVDYLNEIGWMQEHDKSLTEPKQGRWVVNSPITMKCDQCGHVISDWVWHGFDFCPGCGARMKGADDETD